MESVSEGNLDLSDFELAIQKGLARLNSFYESDALNDLYFIDDPIVSLHDPQAQPTFNYNETSSNTNEVPKMSSPRKSPKKSPSKSPRKVDRELSSEYMFFSPFEDISRSQESISLPIIENSVQTTISEMQKVLNQRGDVALQIKEPTFNYNETSSNTNEVPKISSPRKSPKKSPSKSPRKVDRELSSEYMFFSPVEDISRSQESISLPIIENSVQTTISGMQKVLNQRGDVALQIKEPTNETASHLDDRNRGWIPPRRKNYLQEHDTDELKQPRPQKKDKTENKKFKTQKSKQDKKTENQKRKIVKTDSSSSQENKVKELMRIYGCGDKVGKHHSDSTLGSKTVLSKISSKKWKKSSTRANSVAPSKKSSIKIQTFPNTFDNDLTGIEIASRKRIKKHKNQKKNDSKLVIGKTTNKKANLKRKIGTNLSNDKIDSKLSNNEQNEDRDINNNVEQKLRQQKEPRQKHYNSFKENNTTNTMKDNNDTQFKSSKTHHTKHNYEGNHNFKNNQHATQAKKKYIPVNKLSHVTSNEKVLNYLNGPTEEEKSNKNVVNTEINSVNPNEPIANKTDEILNDLLSYDVFNKERGTHSFSPPHMHYTLSTESSRMKEAGRFLHGNFQSFPFVIGQSTNKSHNLFVNIQETLSLMQLKLPHTIEVEPDNSSEAELPNSIISKVSSKKSGFKKHHQCPALGGGLYDIPEMEDGVGHSFEDQPECIKANVDPGSVPPRCVCVPKATMSGKEVLIQVLRDNPESMTGMSGDMAQNGNKIKELQTLLTSHTQEFEDLNNKYDELLKNPDASKEDLERLETELDNKEKEIRQLLASLKEELNERTLGARRSKSSLGLQVRPEQYKSTTTFPQQSEHYKSTNTFPLLTLRRIQRLKDSLSSRPSVSYSTKNVHTKYTLK